MAKDPVCDMDVDEQDSRTKGLMSEQDGKTYYFCSTSCKQEFDRDPEAYASPNTLWEDTEESGGDFETQ